MTGVLTKCVSIANRILQTLRAIKKIWTSGGITEIRISQVAYGQLLKGKRILITGGSAGIGLAIARKCLSESATVVISGRDRERLTLATEELDSSRVFPLVWDVSDINQHGERLDEVTSLLGGTIDILVNNAGILGGHAGFCELTEEKWDGIQAVNSKGLVFLTRDVVIRWLGEKQSGKIINVSSMRGSLGVQDGPYGMSKWALNGLTHGLGLKLAPHGILVNGIAPGIIATNSISIKGMDPTENAFLKCVPVGRIGLAEEVAELAVFLMSDAANYIVGQTIVCDGGYTLKC